MDFIKERNKLIDVLKGIAIILVVLGHSIQYGSGGEFLDNAFFYDNIVFKIIYSFHMPLFMLISGFLFNYTINKYSYIQNIKNRFTTLIVPIFSWSVITMILEIVLKGNVSFLSDVKLFAHVFLDNLWFLWAIFWCSMLVILVNKYFKDNIYLYILIFFISFFIPDISGSALYKFMYPFFMIGYLFCKYNLKNIRIIKYDLVNLFVSGILFIILLLFFTKDSYVYTSHHFILKGNVYSQLVIDLYRTIIGLVGSIFVILLIKIIYKKSSGIISNIMIHIGVNSIGIYILSGYIFTYILQSITGRLPDINYIILLIEAFLITAVTYYFAVLLKKVKLIKILFLGGR